MYTHSDGLYGTLITLVKDKDFGLELESATPAVDQPVRAVDEREVDEMLCVHLTIMALLKRDKSSLAYNKERTL